MNTAMVKMNVKAKRVAGRLFGSKYWVWMIVKIIAVMMMAPVCFSFDSVMPLKRKPLKSSSSTMGAPMTTTGIVIQSDVTFRT